MKNKEIRMCTESAEHRKIAFENLLSERGALLRINRSIQVEGAFGVLKSNRKFKPWTPWPWQWTPTSGRC